MTSENGQHEHHAASAEADLLRIRDLKVDFAVHGGVVEAVKGVSLRIKPGSTVALVGESGSGKSVVSQAVMGILPPIARITGGEILFRDPALPGVVTDIAKLDRESEAFRSLRGQRLSIIFQEPMTSLSPVHTIGDQLSEPLYLHRNLGRAEGEEVTREMLGLVGFPDPGRAFRMYPFELSGGLRQRAMIAMALICRPALLIADEPTTALDVSIQAQILKLIKELQVVLGMSVLMITHDLGVVANVADEIVVVYHGRVMEQGTLEDVFREPGHPYLKALLNAVPHFDMHEGERLVPLREIVHNPDSPLFAERREAPADDGGKPLLKVDNLRKSFTTRKSSLFGADEVTSVTAVDGISFEIERGECFGLVGESGCGKSTFCKMATRALLPDEGSVEFNDNGRIVDLTKLPDRELNPYRQKIQMIFQDPFGSLNPRMTVFDVIREPLVIHQIGDRSSQAETVKELMRVVGLDPRFLNRYPHSFSGGQRQRISIARALALKPELLICDEPVSALDVSIQAQVLNLIKDLQEHMGLTYLFISHNLAVVDYVADRIAVMCRGRLVEMAPREILFKNPVHPYTRGLMAAVPYADLERPLDFDAMPSDSLSDPKIWTEAFWPEGGQVEFVDLEPGHRVLAASGAAAEDLVA